MGLGDLVPSQRLEEGGVWGKGAVVVTTRKPIRALCLGRELERHLVSLLVLLQIHSVALFMVEQTGIL